jgi:c-di-GMP-binding flagellar brake protein YcgR
MRVTDARDRFMPQTSGLTVRQHERAGIELSVELEVCEAHAAQVLFSSTASAAGQHVIRGKAIDISPGGMGIESRQFLPRMVEGTVRVFAPDAERKNRDGSAIQNLVFEQPVKVRRVSQISREPSYNLGVAFLGAGVEMDQRIAALLVQTGNPPVDVSAGGGKR